MTINIPSLNGFEVFVMAGNCIVLPVTTVGENVFVGENTRYLLDS
jgi:hypothetical protein